METFDAIVVGTGGVGSAALYHLAKRGARVLGLDQFHQAHANGSSHGQTRIIRQAYFEHPNYVPLLRRAYELWAELEQEANRKLFHQVGLVEAGPPDGVLIPGIMQSVTQHDLPIEQLTPSEAQARFPLMLDDAMQVVFEPTAGYLLVESCVETHLQLALQAGADWCQQSVLNWSASKRGITVRTDDETFTADRLVICAGAWAAGLVQNLNVELRVIPKHQYWFAGKDHRASEIPAFFLELPAGCFYGFPELDGRGIKIAKHSGGDAIDAPVSLNSLEDAADETSVRGFLRSHVTCARDELLSHQACMYTVSPDEHFVVDRHPEQRRVAFAAGMSGHGFKFASVLGEVLADLSCDVEPSCDIGFLGLGRFDATP